MQKRVRNFRPTWDLKTNQTASSNYYPVTSAITIRDKLNDNGLQMTVMNDRAQGGSSLQDGTIELMQNRRLYKDDNKGLDQPLNETTEFGYGIYTQANYYVEIFQPNVTLSNQRSMQIHIDGPLEVWYRFNETYYDGSKAGEQFFFDYYKFVSFGNVYDSKFKMVMFPMEQNKIMVRLENLLDNYDTEMMNPSLPPAAQVYVIDMKALAGYLFDYVNEGAYLLDSVRIEEVSLTGNQKYTDMQKAKTMWKGMDDKDMPDP